jgi:hypothetical protein
MKNKNNKSENSNQIGNKYKKNKKEKQKIDGGGEPGISDDVPLNIGDHIEVTIDNFERDYELFKEENGKKYYKKRGDKNSKYLYLLEYDFYDDNNPIFVDLPVDDPLKEQRLELGNDKVRKIKQNLGLSSMKTALRVFMEHCSRTITDENGKVVNVCDKSIEPLIDGTANLGTSQHHVTFGPDEIHIIPGNEYTYTQDVQYVQQQGPQVQYGQQPQVQYGLPQQYVQQPQVQYGLPQQYGQYVPQPQVQYGLPQQYGQYVRQQQNGQYVRQQQNGQYVPQQQYGKPSQYEEEIHIQPPPQPEQEQYAPPPPLFNGVPSTTPPNSLPSSMGPLFSPLSTPPNSLPSSLGSFFGPSPPPSFNGVPSTTPPNSLPSSMDPLFGPISPSSPPHPSSLIPHVVFPPPPQTGGGKIKNKSKLLFRDLLNDPNSKYVKYMNTLYLKINNQLLSVNKLYEFINSKDVRVKKEVKAKK